MRRGRYCGNWDMSVLRDGWGFRYERPSHDDGVLHRCLVIVAATSHGDEAEAFVQPPGHFVGRPHLEIDLADAAPPYAIQDVLHEQFADALPPPRRG
jgi:hypothetical protein